MVIARPLAKDCVLVLIAIAILVLVLLLLAAVPL
jgi:hypothetical protein